MTSMAAIFDVTQWKMKDMDKAKRKLTTGLFLEKMERNSRWISQDVIGWHL